MKKFLLGILAGLLIAGVTSVVLMFAAVKFASRAPSLPDKAWLDLRLEGSLAEAQPMTMPLPVLEARAPLTVVETWSALKRAARDPRIQGVLIRPRGLQAGWAKLDELRTGILKVRQAGKPVYAWLSTPGTREYYVATAADRIYLSPEDLVDVKGLRLEATYFKGTLDKLGVEMEVEHIGKYKDAGDTLTRTSMSPETREALNPVLDQIFGGLCSAISTGRKIAPDKVRALVDEGPFLAPKARSAGLVDQLDYEAAAVHDLAAKAKVEEKSSISLRDYLRSDSGTPTGKTKRVAYLVAEGSILRSAGSDLLGEEAAITPHGIAKQAELIGNDTSIRGVILRVDSPGGDAIASDEILDSLKKLSKKKPLVISMADTAASGGYYISMTGDPVLAYPGTLTGSIGVIYGKMNLAGLYAKVGISKEVLKRGRFSDIDSDFQRMTPEGRVKLRESLQFIYDGFLERVGAGRHRKPADIEPLAQGRVWVGAQARAVGLVDELGGLDRAIELIKQKAAIGADEQVRLIPYPAKRSWFEQLMETRTGTETRAPLLALPRGLAPWVAGGILRVMPATVEVH
jgi:protease-4